LEKYQVKGDTVGIFYGFFVGVIGIFSLSLYSISGGMANEAFTNIQLIGCAAVLVGIYLADKARRGVSKA
jgi:hypothetical protein